MSGATVVHPAILVAYGRAYVCSSLGDLGLGSHALHQMAGQRLCCARWRADDHLPRLDACLSKHPLVKAQRRAVRDRGTSASSMALGKGRTDRVSIFCQCLGKRTRSLRMLMAALVGRWHEGLAQLDQDKPTSGGRAPGMCLLKWGCGCK